METMVTVVILARLVWRLSQVSSMFSVNVAVQTAFFCQMCSAQQKRVSVESGKRTRITERIICCHPPSRNVRPSCELQELHSHSGQNLRYHLLMLAEIFKLVNCWQAWRHPDLVCWHSEAVKKPSQGFVYF